MTSHASRSEQIRRLRETNPLLAYVLRTGRTGRGRLFWTDNEIDILRRLYPDYEALQLAIPGRSLKCIRWKACELGLIVKHGRQKPRWSKRLLAEAKQFYETATTEEYRASGLVSRRRLERIASRLGWRRPQRGYALTGNADVDAIKARCFAMRLELKTLDQWLGFSDRYFCGNVWKRQRKSLDQRYVKRARRLLDDYRAMMSFEA